MKKVKSVELDCGAGVKHLMWELLKIIKVSWTAKRGTMAAYLGFC